MIKITYDGNTCEIETQGTVRDTLIGYKAVVKALANLPSHMDFDGKLNAMVTVYTLCGLALHEGSSALRDEMKQNIAQMHPTDDELHMAYAKAAVTGVRLDDEVTMVDSLTDADINQAFADAAAKFSVKADDK